MASLEQHGRSFRIVFRLRGIKYSGKLKTTNERTAQIARLQLEERLDAVQSGALVPPAGVGLVDFLLDGAKTTQITRTFREFMGA